MAPNRIKTTISSCSWPIISPLLALATLAAGVTTAHSAQTSLRRAASVQPVAQVARGDVLLGLGAAYESAVRAPLIAAAGDLGRFGIVDIAYGLADGVVIEVSGDAYRVFRVEGGQSAAGLAAADGVEALDEDILDGVSTGAGDFLVGVTFQALGSARGPSLGGRFLFAIPSSDEDQGLGTNSMSIRMSVLGSYGWDRVRLTGDMGVAILEAPVEHFEQNDVFVYSAELLYSPSPFHPLRIFAAVDGQASTRGRVPLGTEDLGRLNLGADYRVGRWLLDAFGVLGYAGNSADWGVGGGVALVLGRNS